eukprot:CAMPEP_0113280722 /NCGR_PEP_ID=MMETSP0008_2-20120614/27906_1 /TAXON_ID=97485 /ORGANISM="Prymnesium parvum" /LENGTH=40 /DNA_ID=CAMNT_0000131065 /DNA_START=418 /DNA_END=540 /DNA_ORIENTATION=+ /assembly_acc=CAM_ASM_000153
MTLECATLECARVGPMKADATARMRAIIKKRNIAESPRKF